jgi:alkylhydroperoxidase/carboxymuconolactone decarboxylase family protein YurZ
MSESQTLGSKDKLFIAMAAAMGGGCRICAERLHAMAGSDGITPEEQERAFLEGLRARESATKVMRRKAETLIGRELRHEGNSDGGSDLRILELSRLAAAVAANSSPDALLHMADARAAGASDSEIEIAIGTARMVRSKAQGFSDEEVGALRQNEAEEAPCPLETEQAEAPSRMGGCCS